VDAAEKKGTCLRMYIFRKSYMYNETAVAYFMLLNWEPAKFNSTALLLRFASYSLQGLYLQTLTKFLSEIQTQEWGVNAVNRVLQIFLERRGNTVHHRT